MLKIMFAKHEHYMILVRHSVSAGGVGRIDLSKIENIIYSGIV